MKRTELKRKTPLRSYSGPTIVDDVCAVCGAAFTYPRSHPTKTCSRACGGVLRRTQIETTCKHCGKTFSYNPSQLKAYKGAGQFCSRKCSYQGIVEKTRTKPIQDRYGRSRRKADIEWQAAVRERDDFTCRRCGKYDPHIHAHHVAPRGRRPDLKYDVSNGICLDGVCHQWVHSNPLEAEALGLLSNAKYEMRFNEERHQRIAETKRLKIDDEVLRLHAAGLKPQAIADQIGCSDGPVRRVLRSAGIPPNPPGYQHS